MQFLPRRSLFSTLALCALGAWSAFSAMAQDYPNKSIRLIVPFAAGGAVGAVARVLSTPLQVGLGQSIVIDNRGGAGGIIGMDAVAKSPPDGYTLLLAHSGITYMPGLYRTLPFDPEKDFEPVITAVTGLYVLAVSNDAPFKTIAEMVAYAKANPSKLSYGSAGIGSTLHLGTEFLKRAAGINIIHVPYKGAAQATTDLVGGQIPLMFGPSPVLVPMVQAGRLRGLAYTGLKRSPQLPNLPTADELGVKGYEATGWYGIYGPRGLPRAIVEQLNRAVNKIIDMPDTRERFNALNLEPVGGTPEQFAEFLKADLKKYADIAKKANIQPE